MYDYAGRHPKTYTHLYTHLYTHTHTYICRDTDSNINNLLNQRTQTHTFIAAHLMNIIGLDVFATHGHARVHVHACHARTRHAFPSAANYTRVCTTPPPQSVFIRSTTRTLRCRPCTVRASPNNRPWLLGANSTTRPTNRRAPRGRSWATSTTRSPCVSSSSRSTCSGCSRRRHRRTCRSRGR